VRILYLNPSGQMGGAETSLLELMANIRAAEPDWELWLALGEDGPLAGRAKALGIQVIVEPFPPAVAKLGDAGRRPLAILASSLGSATGIARYARRLAGICRAIDPDIIHTNGFKMHILGVWGRSAGTPVIWHIRDYISSRSMMKVLLRLHAGRCRAAIANSESVSSDIRSVCGPRLETHCVYNAVDLKRYSPEGEKADLDSLSGLPAAEPGTIRIGLVATLARWKGHSVFLKALSLLPRDLRCRGYVIGGPIYQTKNSQHTLEELRSLAAQLQVGGQTGFTGFIEDSALAMRALDIVVHASTEPEPFGRVIAEAMACGRPVISSLSGGSRELVTEGYDALGHPPGDHVTLAKRMHELARDPELRARMGRAGRATAERRFDSRRLAADLIPIYRRAIAQPAPGVPAQPVALR
jgi:glycosyltransferase involved in cell wall biosynthesis